MSSKTRMKFHRDSWLSQLIHFHELIYIIRFKLDQLFRSGSNSDANDNLFCENILMKVSQSFSTVISRLPDELRKSLGIFYLILRALDTVEDDPAAFQNKKDRIKALKSFHTHLIDPNWKLDGVGEANESILLQNFDKVIRVFLQLRTESQEIITDITRRMADGMSEIIKEKLDGTQGTKTMEEYNKYCYYVGGLVGEGIHGLLSASDGNIECRYTSLTERIALGVAYGKFMQKTNILKDYLEDYLDGRSFWPHPVWSKYVKNLGDLAMPENSKAAVDCLNELVLDALELVPNSLICLNLITNPEIVQSFVIPFIVHLATLSKIYNNPNVFTGLVKIRKGLAAYIMYNFDNMDSVLEKSVECLDEISDKIDVEDINGRNKILAIRKLILEQIKNRGTKNIEKKSAIFSFVMVVLIVGLVIIAVLGSV